LLAQGLTQGLTLTLTLTQTLFKTSTMESSTGASVTSGAAFAMGYTVPYGALALSRMHATVTAKGRRLELLKPHPHKRYSR
jgi:hypothetical protein